MEKILKVLNLLKNKTYKLNNIMKIYKWEGKGHYLGATVICIADCLKSAIEMIEKELIDNGLALSGQESEEIEEIEINDCRLIYIDNGDY